MSPYDPDHDGIYWRIQDAGLPLSRSHRSETWSEDETDPGEAHDGTSVVRSCEDLRRANPSIHVGNIEIVSLEGDEVGDGWDGEPVVIPTRELRRLRWTHERGQFFSIADLPRPCTPEALLAAGWTEVETREIAE